MIEVNQKKRGKDRPRKFPCLSSPCHAFYPLLFSFAACLSVPSQVVLISLTLPSTLVDEWPPLASFHLPSFVPFPHSTSTLPSPREPVFLEATYLSASKRRETWY